MPFRGRMLKRHWSKKRWIHRWLVALGSLTLDLCGLLNLNPNDYKLIPVHIVDLANL